MRFKVVQAMSAGVPVVTTRFGASGVAVTGEHVTFAESARDFAAGILSVCMCLALGFVPRFLRVTDVSSATFTFLR